MRVELPTLTTAVRGCIGQKLTRKNTERIVGYGPCLTPRNLRILRVTGAESEVPNDTA